MTKSDCFNVMECVAKRKLEGVMVHDVLSDAFSIMNMPAFYKIHKHRALEEFKEFQNVKDYIVVRYGKIPSTEGASVDDKSILNFGQKYDRDNLNIENKKRIVAYLLEYIVQWESETIDLLSKKYKELFNSGAIAESIFVSELIEDTDEELEMFIKSEIKFKDLNYDMSAVVCE
ncbi:MAG: hypothetical protein RR744_00520 [Cellulosilyticaceae bacterium]